MSDEDFKPGRLPENQQLVNEGYTVKNIPQFGLTPAGIAITPGFQAFETFGDDAHGISIGPDSEVDAVEVESRSFGGQGRLTITKQSPFVGYIKGPFRIFPHYVNNLGSLAVLFPPPPPTNQPGLYKAQVIIWTKPPCCLLPMVRPQKRYEFLNIQTVPQWWTGTIVWVPCFGRKKIRVGVFMDQTPIAPFPVGLAVGLSSFAFAEKVGAVQESAQITQDYSAVVAGPQPFAYWPTIFLNTQALFQGLNWEALLEMEQLVQELSTGQRVNSMTPRRVRPDWLGVSIATPTGADPGDARQIDIAVAVMDE